MKAFTEAVDRAREALRFFAAAPELRLLHIVVSAETRLAVLTEIADAETNRRNKSPFVFLESPFEDLENGWAGHTAELDEEVLALREEAQAAAPPLVIGTVPERPPEPRGLREFGARLGAVLRALPKEMGLGVVLAPLGVSDPEKWAQAVRLLAASERLSRARFLVVETTEGKGAPLTAELGAAGEVVDARPEAKGALATLSAILSSIKSAPVGAQGHRSAGMAGPSVVPPKRLREGTANSDAIRKDLTEAGQSGALANAKLAQDLRVATLSAAEAFHQGRPADAVQHQTRARDVCLALGLPKEAALLELALGAYLLQSGATDRALEAFDRAIGRGRSAGAPEVEVQGQMAKGAALLVAQRHFDAAQAYTEGGRAGESLPSPLLAIECYRMVGQVLVGLKRDQEAQSAFGRALALANGASVDKRVGSSAPVAARELAEIYRRHGMRPQADSLLAQAAAWEAEVPPEPPQAPDSEHLAKVVLDQRARSG